ARPVEMATVPIPKPWMKMDGDENYRRTIGCRRRRGAHSASPKALGPARLTLCVGRLPSASDRGGMRSMIKTVEAVIEEQGHVRLLEPVAVPRSRRALLTILEEDPAPNLHEIAHLSESALAEDWNRPEEEAAWSHLQQGR